MVSIRLASTNDLPVIASIHKMSYSKIHLTSLFSNKLLEKYYSYFLDHDCKIFLSVQTICGQEEILGFVVCGINIGKKISLFKSQKKFQILRDIIFYPIQIIKKILKDVYSSLLDTKISFIETDFLILSIVSSKKVKGIGSILLEYCRNYSLANNYKRIGLYVRVSNIPAINTYLKNGYQIVGYTSGQYYMEQFNN